MISLDAAAASKGKLAIKLEKASTSSLPACQAGLPDHANDHKDSHGLAAAESHMSWHDILAHKMDS